MNYSDYMKDINNGNAVELTISESNVLYEYMVVNGLNPDEYRYDHSEHGTVWIWRN